ncbi:MAG: peptide chain release factor N(5)-glutamine methyltransferase [Spiroplasma phoeniceum]|uniref:peptide chain release factor N(5)-glutamine methyltransferase n=1 Tax=Spiroplasma phoeniceum TaxID=47835 RepID=UPI00328CF04F
MTVNELIQNSEDYLKDSNNANYLADIKILIAFFMKTSLAKLYAIQNDKINFKIDDYWQQLMAYRNGKPIQHITNLQNFYGYDFYVDYNVLIPRYETEELVDNINIIIDEILLNNGDEPLTLIDIGTGSGAIAISLGLENPSLTIYASDISTEALKVAKRNIKQLNCKNVKLLEGDMLEPFIKNKIKADLLVCNPPYIPKNQNISNRVKNYEPHVALFGDIDGLYFYREIFQNWQKVVKKNGILCFEHGYDQKKDLEKLVKEYFPNQKYYFQKDINKKWRMLFINIL